MPVATPESLDAWVIAYYVLFFGVWCPLMALFLFYVVRAATLDLCRWIVRKGKG